METCCGGTESVRALGEEHKSELQIAHGKWKTCVDCSELFVLLPEIGTGQKQPGREDSGNEQGAVNEVKEEHWPRRAKTERGRVQTAARSGEKLSQMLNRYEKDDTTRKDSGEWKQTENHLEIQVSSIFLARKGIPSHRGHENQKYNKCCCTKGGLQ